MIFHYDVTSHVIVTNAHKTRSLTLESSETVENVFNSKVKKEKRKQWQKNRKNS